jgi:hypothetical protein
MTFQLWEHKKISLFSHPGGRLCTKEMVRDVPIELGGHIFLGMNWMYQR